MRHHVTQRFLSAAFLALSLQGGVTQLLAQQSITLEEARRRAHNVDPAVIAARSSLNVAHSERRGAIADLFTPSVTASAGFTSFSDPFFNFGTGNISSNATSATLEARYSVIGGGKLSARRRAAASLASADASEIAARFQSDLATDAAFYAVVVEKDMARAASERLRRAEEQLNTARVRVLAGDALATDSLQLLLEVSRARIDVLRRDSALIVARLRLGAQAGVTGPLDAQASADSVPPVLPPQFSLEAATAEMLQRGPALEAARARERHADAALSGEREAYLPDVSLSAVAGRYDSRFFPSALKRNQISLLVSVPIWDAGRRGLQVSRARAESDVATAERAASERSASELMAQVYQGYQTAIAEIRHAGEAVVAAQENYRVHSTRYREGAGMILDVLQAQVDLVESETALARARHGARVAFTRIESLLGRRLN